MLGTNVAKFLRAIAKRRRRQLLQNSCDAAAKSPIVTLQIIRGVRPVPYGTGFAEGDGRQLVFGEPVNHGSRAAIERAGEGAGRTAGKTVEGGRAAEGSHQSSVSSAAGSRPHPLSLVEQYSYRQSHTGLHW